MTLSELVYACFDRVYERDNGEVWVDCCFCDDGKNRLGINLRTGQLHCFKCETKSADYGNIVNSKRKAFRLISEQTSHPGIFTIEEEEDATSIKTKKKIVDTEVIKAVTLPREFEPLWRDINDKVGKKALAYIKSRGLTDQQIKDFAVGFCSNGYYAGRIVFPVYYGTKLEGIVSRDFTGQAEIKYLNSKGIKTLYNIPRKRFRQKKCLLVEGVFDVLACLRASLKGYDVIACLGSKLTPRQLKMLKGYLRIIIWAEPDRAGVEGTIKRAKQLIKKKAKVYVIMPDRDPDIDTDPGAMFPEEILDRVKEATKFTSGVAQIMRTRIAFHAPPKKKKGKLNGKDIRKG